MRKVEIMVESRLKKSYLNARVNVLFYFITLFISFFSRKIFLDMLGADFVGLMGTLQNLLGFLNLAELGIGASIGYVLYKPIFDKDEKKKIKEQAWAEQAHTINEVGSTYTIQGFDLNYAGVILGKSVKYRDGKIVYDPSESSNGKATKKRTMEDGTKQNFAKELLKHEVRVLMTRGVNGLYIYACDDQLREALKKAAEQE